LTEHPDLVQQILARIQVEAPPEQIVSARLLPEAESVANSEVTPIEDDVAVEAPVEDEASVEDGVPVEA
jgi:hypothetical protein